MTKIGFNDNPHTPKIGYARVSTKDQKLEMQRDALDRAGCLKVYEEKRTGTNRERPQLEAMLDQLRPLDIVVVWKLDRLGRSLKDLVDIVNQISSKGAGLHSLNDHIDTTTPTGKLTFHIFAALAEFESAIIRERTNAGLEAARARGRVGGRKKGLSDKAKQTALIAQTLNKAGDLSVAAICEQLSIGRSTFYKYLKYKPD